MIAIDRWTTTSAQTLEIEEKEVEKDFCVSEAKYAMSSSGSFGPSIDPMDLILRATTITS